jgi:hypothetical protein
MFPAPVVRTLAGGVALALLLASYSSPTEAQARERVLYVNAFDAETRKPVADLTARDLIVREDGVTREVLRVERAKSPMPIALLVDNTQAASSAIADIRRAVTAFLAAAEGLGPVALVTVADRPTIVVDYTTSQKDLQAGIARLFATPGSGATLLDSIREAARGLAKRESDRAGVVVLTTENVEFSNLHYTQVLEALRDSGAQMHAVVLINTRSSLFNEEARNRATVLDRGPRESGGVRIDVLASSAFESQLQDLANVLKSQYRVIYGRPDSLIPPERVEVSAVKAGIEVRGSPARGQTGK